MMNNLLDAIDAASGAQLAGWGLIWLGAAALIWLAARLQLKAERSNPDGFLRWRGWFGGNSEPCTCWKLQPGKRRIGVHCMSCHRRRGGNCRCDHTEPAAAQPGVRTATPLSPRMRRLQTKQDRIERRLASKPKGRLARLLQEWGVL